MTATAPSLPDLMPPPFADGLDDWSRGDGTPDSPTYEASGLARLARDAEFGVCLELRTAEPVQRLRYMGEVPFPAGAFVEVSARIKVVRGPLPEARIAAWPGGAHGRPVTGLRVVAEARQAAAHGTSMRLCTVFGPSAVKGVDLVWDRRVLYAHVGLDLLGGRGAVVRVESLCVREVTERFAGGRQLPGFAPIAFRR